MEPNPTFQRLAILLVVQCFRNTVLENYHAEWPQFTDPKMKALMQESVNKMYTALCTLFAGGPDSHVATIEYMNLQCPTGWDTPEFDRDFLVAVEAVKHHLRKRAEAEDAGDSDRPETSV